MYRLWGIVLIIAPLVAGCATRFDDASAPYPNSDVIANQIARDAAPQMMRDAPALECVPFARDHSQVKIYGDAYTWWDQAAARYPRSGAPQSGAVMVLSGYAGPERGHLAVVQTIISPREIRVDHANWLDDGAIYLNDPVADVSPGNDWSQVRVFNIQTGAWGGHIYPVQGFILPPGGAVQAPPLTSQLESAANPGPVALAKMPEKAR